MYIKRKSFSVYSIIKSNAILILQSIPYPLITSCASNPGGAVGLQLAKITVRGRCGSAWLVVQPTYLTSTLNVRSNHSRPPQAAPFASAIDT